MSLERSAAAAPPSGGVWPTHLRAIGAIRFGRRSARFAESVDFYRNLIGLPVHETFADSYQTTGVIFGLPGAPLTLEIVKSEEPVPVDPHDQLCLYFPTQQAQDDARHRLTAAGAAPIPSHPYWAATGAVTYRDPDGREVVFAPFVYGQNEPTADAPAVDDDDKVPNPDSGL